MSKVLRVIIPVALVVCAVTLIVFWHFGAISDVLGSLLIITLAFALPMLGRYLFRSSARDMAGTSRRPSKPADVLWSLAALAGAIGWAFLGLGRGNESAFGLLLYLGPFFLFLVVSVLLLMRFLLSRVQRARSIPKRPE